MFMLYPQISGRKDNRHNFSLPVLMTPTYNRIQKRYLSWTDYVSISVLKNIELFCIISKKSCSQPWFQDGFMMERVTVSLVHWHTRYKWQNHTNWTRTQDTTGVRVLCTTLFLVRVNSPPHLMFIFSIASHSFVTADQCVLTFTYIALSMYRQIMILINYIHYILMHHTLYSTAKEK